MFRFGSVVATALLLVSVARADVRWNLTTADFQTQAINLLAIDGTSVRFIDKASNDQTTPLDQFVSLQTAVSKPPRGAYGKSLLYLADGATVSGEITSMQDEKLLFTNDVFGKLSFTLKQITRIDSIARAGGLKKMPPSQTEDVVQLANGDTVRGVVLSMSLTTVSIKTEAGPSDVPLSNIASVAFATSGTPADRKAKGFRVQLDDGSSLAVDGLTLQGSAVAIVIAGETRTLDLDKLTSIEQINGPVAWLSALTPSENIQTPFLEATWPARMNLSATSEPIRFGSRTFTHGIGVHSRSHLTWTLDGSFKSFRTQYATDPNLPYADMDVRILLDGKVAHEAKSVKDGSISPVVALDLTGVKTITLEVDFGAGYDVQDRLNWIEPALLRSAVANPTTQP